MVGRKVDELFANGEILTEMADFANASSNISKTCGKSFVLNSNFNNDFALGIH